MNARLHDSVRSRASSDEFEEQLRRDGLRFRKLGLLLNRGDWQARPNVEAAAGGFAGPMVGDLDTLRAGVDRTIPTRIGRFE